jgi:hypothetical protein
MTSRKPEFADNKDTFSDEVLVEFTLEALPGDTVFPGRERKGRPPIPEWMKNPSSSANPTSESDSPR